MGEDQSWGWTSALLPFLTVLVIICMIGAPTAAQSPTPVPGAYYGNVTINGEPAPDGLVIEAEIDGEIRGSVQTKNGAFGGPNADHKKLTVTGNVDEDQEAEVTFYISGENIERTPANQTIIWESAAIEQINLSVDLPANGTPDDGSGPNRISGGGGSTSGGDSSSVSMVSQIVDSRPNERGTTVTFSQSRIASITFSREVQGTVEINDYGVQLPPNSPSIGDRPVLAGFTITTSDGAATTPATVEVVLEQDEIDNRNIDPSDLTVLRATDTGYMSLPTTVSDRSGIVLQAETPGFSTFAVTTVSGSDQSHMSTSSSSTPDEQNGSTGNTTGETPNEETDGSIPGFTVSLAVLAILLAGLLVSKLGEL